MKWSVEEHSQEYGNGNSGLFETFGQAFNAVKLKYKIFDVDTIYNIEALHYYWENPTTFQIEIDGVLPNLINAITIRKSLQ